MINRSGLKMGICQYGLTSCSQLAKLKKSLFIRSDLKNRILAQDLKWRRVSTAGNPAVIEELKGWSQSQIEGQKTFFRQVFIG